MRREKANNCERLTFNIFAADVPLGQLMWILARYCRPKQPRH